MRGILIIGVFLAFFPISLFAGPPQANRILLETKKDTDRIKEEMKRLQEEQLKELKKNNPELYKERMDDIERWEEINKIVVSYRDGKISEARAVKELYPLVEKSLENYIDGLDERIAKVEKKLESLKDVKSDPDMLIKKRIEQLLGKTVPSPEDLLM
jgi:uncharacterized coiled-coil protein SlyX